MARVDFLVQAIDRASKTFDTIARSGKVLDTQLNAVSRTTDKVDKAFQRVKETAKDAADGLARVDRASQKAADKMRLAADQARRLGDNERKAADAALALRDRLDSSARAAEKQATATRGAAQETEKLTRAIARQRTVMAGMGTQQLRNAAAAVAGNAAATAATNTSTAALAKNQAQLATLGRGWRFLGQEVTLFAGLLPGVKVWHFALDAIVESLAVLVPALATVAAGLGAFGAAAFDAGRQIAYFLVNIHNIHDATGKALPPLTNNLEKLHDAVKPVVFQLFGDAILVAAKKSGLFNQLAMETSRVLERMGLKITTAILHNQGGMEKFFAVGARDAKQFGIVLENIGKVLFKLIQISEQTHIAEFLLQGLVVASKLLGLIVKLPTPLLAVAFALHGVYLWGGLAVTKIAQLVGVLAGMTNAAVGIKSANREVTKLGANATPVGKLKAVFTDLAIGVQAIPGRISNVAKAVGRAVHPVGLLGRVSSALLKVPWGAWAGLAVGALVLFTVAAARAKDATQKWIDTIDQGILKSPIDKALRNISDAQVLVKNKLDLATNALDKQRAALGDTTVQTGRYLGQTIAASRSVNELTGEQSKLTQQYDKFTGRLAGVQRIAGKTLDAQGLLVAAGITTSDMLSTQSDAWNLISTAVRATIVAYKDMGQSGTTLTNDLEVMNKTTDSQQQAVQKLNQAWDSFIGNITATQNSFDTVAQSVQTLGSAFDKARQAGLQVSVAAGKIKDKFELVRAPIDSVTKSGIALNQAFTQQVGNIQTLLDSLRQANISANLFKKAVQDSIAPMLQYAKGSQEATAQLIGLAQEAGFHGPASFKRLVEWVGKTHGALGDLKKITNQATIQNALLTDSMDAQSKMIAGSLLAELNAAELKYSVVTKDVTAYGKAIAQSGKDSDQARGARTRLLVDLIQTQTEAGKSKRAIAGMIATILHIPYKKALRIVMHGDGSFQIGQVITKPIGGGRYITNRAAGGMITGGSPGKDSVLANLMPGEVVVPTKMVQSGAVDHLRGSLPGFAGGGLVTGGDRSVLSGQFVNKAENAYTANAANHMVAAMRSALSATEKAAIAAKAAASGGGVGVAGPGGGQPSANAALARKMMPAWGSGAEWAAWNTLEMHEASWNQYARNGASGAYGIPQALPPSKMGAAANPPQSNVHAQISWMIGYIKGRYGDPINAWAQYYNHPGGVGWYDKGGVLKPGVTTAVNNTGHDEWVINPVLGGKQASGSGGGKGAPVIVAGFAAGGESDINRIVKNLKTINDSINAGVGAGDGGGGDLPLGPPAGGPKKGTPHRKPLSSLPGKIDTSGPSYDEHLRDVERLKVVQAKFVKDTRNLTITGAAILKAEAEHKPKAFIDQLKHLFREEKKQRDADEKHRDSLRSKAGGIYGPNPLTDLRKDLHSSRSALAQDKKELAKAIKDHAKPAWIEQLKKLEKQAEQRAKNAEKAIKAEEAKQKAIRKGKDDGPKHPGPHPKPAPGSGGGGGGAAGGGLGSGGGSGAGSAHVREEVAVLKEIRTATKEAKNELVSIRALLKKDLDEIASNTHPARQAAATSKAMQSTAVSAGHAGQNKTRRP